MIILRLKSLRQRSRDRYELTLDVVDSEADRWDVGDCLLRLDLVDGPTRHIAEPRGLLRQAFELRSLSRDEPPSSREAKLLWEIGCAVDSYVEGLFAARVICPFSVKAEAEAAGQQE